MKGGATVSLLLGFVLLGISLGYAAVRYHGFGGVSLEQAPLYVANKGISFCGLALLALARMLPHRARRRELGLLGMALTGWHVLMSLPLLTPAYFPKFFGEAGRFTWQAEAALAGGGAGLLLLFWLLFATRSEQQAGARSASLLPLVGRLVLLAAALHVGLIGYPGWLAPAAWPGYLPPITLLSFAVALLGCCWPRPPNRS